MEMLSLTSPQHLHNISIFSLNNSIFRLGGSFFNNPLVPRR